jgi:hypothetical protein
MPIGDDGEPSSAPAPASAGQDGNVGGGNVDVVEVVVVVAGEVVVVVEETCGGGGGGSSSMAMASTVALAVGEGSDAGAAATDSARYTTSPGWSIQGLS